MEPTTLFLDTGPLLARRLAKDSLHAQAVAGWERMADSGVLVATSNFVIAEFATLLTRRAGAHFAAECVQGLYESRFLQILRPDEKDEIAALRTLRARGDSKLSFTDCTSFVLMQRHDIQCAFTFDGHFQTSGFEIWPTK